MEKKNGHFGLFMVRYIQMAYNKLKAKSGGQWSRLTLTARKTAHSLRQTDKKFVCGLLYGPEKIVASLRQH